MIKRIFTTVAASIAALAVSFLPASAQDGECTAAENPGAEHIFTHELVFDTAKAFSPNNKLRNCFDKDHLTAKEFSAILSALYDNNYVLVGADAALTCDYELPQGKRAVVMSFDDMTYDTVGRGCIDKIIFDGGKLSDYTQNAEPQITRERENITILETFIERHPEFSHDGARATLCVNGYNGILGYRVTPGCNVSETYRQKEIEACRETVSKLKELGYTFASHTYYHKYFNSMSAADIERDLVAWDKYIRPIVGDTRIVCFPAGEHNAKSAKFDAYKKHGFDIFFCVGDGPTEYERGMKDARFVYRKPLDGTSLRLYRKNYAHMLDTAAVYDTSRFRPFSYKGGYYAARTSAVSPFLLQS